jgi:PhnB protein
MSNVKAIPEGYESAIPYLSIRGAADALAFYQRAFGAEVREQHAGPGGMIMHAELRLGRAVIFAADEFAEMKFVGPQSLGGTTVGVHLYVENVDALVERAVKAGATVERPPSDQFYGDRNATLLCPFGHRWMFSSRKENLTPEQIREREAAQHGKK